jgi:ankyrin repeat protein
VQLLLERNARANGADRWHRSPLHKTSYAGHTAVVVALLGHGASVTARDDVRPARYACFSPLLR